MALLLFDWLTGRQLAPPTNRQSPSLSTWHAVCVSHILAHTTSGNRVTHLVPDRLPSRSPSASIGFETQTANHRFGFPLGLSHCALSVSIPLLILQLDPHICLSPIPSGRHHPVGFYGIQPVPVHCSHSVSLYMRL